MKIVIDAEAIEIAELLLALEARQEEKVDVEKVVQSLHNAFSSTLKVNS